MRRILILGSILFLFGFAILSKYEDRAFLRNLDFAVTVKVQERIDGSNHLRTASLIGNVMEGATFFASPEFTVVVTLILTGLALYDRRRKRWNLWALIIPIALTLLVGAEIYGKSIVHHPSPPFSMIKNPVSLFPAGYVNEQFSYPSGHAARAAFLSFLSFSLFMIHDSVFKRKKWRMLVAMGCIGYIGLVGVSRIYLGHHWFSDVAGGLFLGATLGVLTWVSIPRYNTPTMSD